MYRTILLMLVISLGFTACNDKKREKEEACKELQNEFDKKYKVDYLSFKLKELPKEWKAEVKKYNCIIIGDERQVTRF